MPGRLFLITGLRTGRVPLEVHWHDTEPTIEVSSEPSLADLLLTHATRCAAATIVSAAADGCSRTQTAPAARCGRQQDEVLSEETPRIGGDDDQALSQPS